MEETQAKIDRKIGTKELQVLKPVKVKIAGVKLETKTIKKGGNSKEVDIAILICKHPDREETIEISKVKLVKGSTVRTYGLWYDEDEDGLIQKGSAIAELLEHCLVQSLKELEGKDLDTTTESESSNYLVIKAY